MAVREQEGDKDFPWWLVAAVLIGIAAALGIASSEIYPQILSTLLKGLLITIRVTLIGYALASILGLIFALMGLSRFLVVRQIARFYIEIIRGIPMMVLLFFIAFVGAPAMVSFWNVVTGPLQSMGLIGPMQIRDFSLEWRAIIALMIGYSAFLAEIFRAGIQSVEIGQVEAAKALGLSNWQRFRLVVWPQAFRTIMPPYSNDFIAMVKDSSLVSVLGVADITQAAKIYYSSSFRYLETLSMAAYIYLILTIGLSLLLRQLERRMRSRQTTAPEH